MHVYKQAGTIFNVCVKLRNCNKHICVNIQDVHKYIHIHRLRQVNSSVS
jgi:hypothetical protein